ncbi:S-adenosyl-L-methionine-dependent methyltransferase [Aspergillus varians]
MGTETAATAIAELSLINVSDPATHSDIIRKCQSIISTLQEPGAVVMETLAGVAKYPCLVAISNLGIFEKLSLDGPLKADQLAEKCGADRWLVVRLMRVAVAWEIVTEIAPEHYAPTATSRIFAVPAFAAGLRNCHFSSQVIESLPQYLEETQYRNPTDETKSLFQYHFKTDLELFEWRSGNKAAMDDFNLFMTIQRTRGQHWQETFNVGSRILDGVEIDTSLPLLVDIAGGFGQDLCLLKTKLAPGYNVTKGQLVLEDQDTVINNIPADMYDADFKYVAHNFFTLQPVKGARIYSLKGVLHDWPDHKAVEILRHTAKALTPGYSKVWILDGIIPDMGADKVMVGLDIGMMALFGALERNKEQWTQLLAQAGLKITSVSTLPDGFGLIEAELDA